VTTFSHSLSSVIPFSPFTFHLLASAPEGPLRHLNLFLVYFLVAAFFCSHTPPFRSPPFHASIFTCLPFMIILPAFLPPFRRPPHLLPQNLASIFLKQPNSPTAIAPFVSFLLLPPRRNTYPSENPSIFLPSRKRKVFSESALEYICQSKSPPLAFQMVSY